MSIARWSMPASSRGTPRVDSAAAASVNEVSFFRSREARGNRILTLSVDVDGSVRIGGQDLGASVSEAFGSAFTEYEWDWTLAAASIPRALELLGGSPGEQLVVALGRWAEANKGRDPGQFLRDAGLELGFWSRIGD